MSESGKATGSPPAGPAPSGSEVRSPFRSEESENTRYESEWEAPPTPGQLDSPFRSAARETERGPVDPENEAVRELLSELYEDELEEAFAELLEEASAVHAESEAAMVGRLDPAAVQAPVREWLEPLAQQSEDMLESLAAAAGNADSRSLTENEIEALFESASIAPSPQLATSPAFEQFFGALKNFAKKAVKGAANLAKKGITAVGKVASKVLPVAKVMGYLKQMVRPMLMRVLKVGIKRLPGKLRPFAAKLAKKLLHEAPQSEAEQSESLAHGPTAVALGEDPEATAPSPAAELALEVAGATAGLLLASEEHESENWLAEANAVLSGEADEAEAYESGIPAAAVQSLDEARERFTEALAQLPDGGDPRPALEEFIPVVMGMLPIAREVVKWIGRPKVVNTLSGLLAQLIGKWVRPREAKILSAAIVDTGLKLLNMEAEAEDPQRTAATALTATVEDTVRRLAELPSEELEDLVRLEPAAGSAFNAAVAANIPSTLLREDLEELEARGVKGMWIQLPRTKPRRFRYKKYARVFEVTLDARQAAELRTAEGVRLNTLLRDRFRVRAFPVRLRVHLYESMHGAWARQIMAAEKRHAHGKGPVALLPLSTRVAGALLGQPGLGRDGKRVVKGRALAQGTRLFGVELVDHRSAPGAQHAPAAANALSTVARKHRTTRTRLTVDARAGRNTVVVALYLAEERAQALLNSAGSPPQIGAVLAGLSTDLADGAVTALLAGQGRDVRIFREGYEQSAHLSPTDEGEEFVSKLPPQIRDALAAGLKRAAGNALAQYFKGRLDEFVRALQMPEEGLTLVVTLHSAPLVDIITGIRSGKVPPLSALSAAIGALAAEPSAKVEIHPGHRRG
ncbi:hypothetical protein AB0L85_29285 [Streptomyces sp. NPDC052051]|uniref:hypothetical protein n=1 Tax=Streptomyces sp. NPDC052051 TaxID=3154649 RepID=UPI00342BD6E6